jgi:hypothetical protein
MIVPTFESLKVGDEIPALKIPPVSRHTLALYCGASGDHNPIHVDQDYGLRRPRNTVPGYVGKREEFLKLEFHLLLSVIQMLELSLCCAY